ncbi:hypothetical protein OKA06_16455 [Novosphingobium sp. MW5]|nr:hypothetical protein [Novosphingobium sp. MW5]
MKMKTNLIIAALVLVQAGGASANSLIAPGEHKGIAKSTITTTTSGEWNKLSRTDGPGVETWTRDGDNLNKVSFFGGIAPGLPIYKERNKKEAPLPKIAGNMLLPDIPTLLESTYRSQYQVNRMNIDSQDLATINGKQAIRFTYSYMRGEDEVERKGEAVATIINKKLYMVTYEAPAIYFFGKDLEDFRRISQNLKF